MKWLSRLFSKKQSATTPVVVSQSVSTPHPPEKIKTVNCPPGDIVQVTGTYICTMCDMLGSMGGGDTIKQFSKGNRFDASCWLHKEATGWSLINNMKPTEKESFVNQLKAVDAKNLPDDWTSYGGNFNELECQLKYPKTWIKGKDGNVTIFRPDTANMIDDAGRPTISPGLTFFFGTHDSLKDDALLKSWHTQISKQHKGFVSHESDIVTLAGVPTLAVYYDFQKPCGNWSCYVTVRVRGNIFWYFDANGLPVDLERLRSQIVPVLGSVSVSLMKKDKTVELPSERGADMNSSQFKLVCKKCGQVYTLGKDSISMTSEEAGEPVGTMPPKLMIGRAGAMSTPQLIRECYDQSLRLGPSRGWNCTKCKEDNPWPQA